MKKQPSTKPLTFRRLEDKILHKDRNSDPAVKQMFFDLRKFCGVTIRARTIEDERPSFENSIEQLWYEVPLYHIAIEQTLNDFVKKELKFCHSAENLKRGKALLFIVTKASEIQTARGKDPILERFSEELSDLLAECEAELETEESNGN